MHNTPIRTVVGEVTDFLASNPTPEDIIAYQLPQDLGQRAHDLLDKNGEDELSEAERAAIVEFMQMDQMMMLLKAKTRLKTKHDTNIW